MRVKKALVDEYWTGSTWTATETWKDVTSGTTTWSYTTVPTWTSGDSYLVQSKATDGASNVETPAVSVSWTFDNVSPTSIVTVPANNAKLKTLAYISGTADDVAPGVGLSVVRISIKKCWNN